MSVATTSQPRRVVITGMGVVSPLGHSVASAWNSLLEGKSGVGKITHFNPSLEGNPCPVQIAAEVRNYDVANEIDAPNFNPKEVKRMGRFIQLSLGATWQAFRDAGLEQQSPKISWDRVGANIGVGMGGLPEIESVHLDLVNKGFRRVTPFLIPQIIPNMASGQASILLGLKGPNLCIVTACASSAHAIGESFRTIQRGEADIMVSGGAEAVISPLGIGGFAAMRALSTRNQSPTEASRPFDAERDGFVMGEGAVTLILEDLEHALRRGARIYAEIGGYGLSGDAYHMTTPAPEGEGGLRSMKMAIRELTSGARALKLSDIGYVNAHGTSTPAGDAEEARAIARALSVDSSNLNLPVTERVYVSSTKSMSGHMLGAAGAFETMVCVMAIREGRIPPTINLNNLDPACAATGLDFVAHQAVSRSVEAALSNSFGFGGTNASLIVRRYRSE